MKLPMLTLSLIGLGGLAGGGCVVHERHEPRAVVYEDRGPVVVDTYYYYDRGYYDGPYWVYCDHEGHWYRERHEDHERRERYWATHGREEHFVHSSGAERGNFGRGGGVHGGAEHGAVEHGGGGRGGSEGHGGEIRGR